MSEWFTVEQIDEDTYAISEYKHWEETHCYLLNGTERSLLIDTGMGIDNIKGIVNQLTDKPVIALPTHTHWDHIGGLKYFDEFYVHEDEEEWINGNFPLTLEYIKSLVIEEPCDFPPDFDLDKYEIFQGQPSKVLKDGDIIDLGNRKLKVIHTPGHAPGHICLYEEAKEYLYSGDLIYIGKLTAFFPTSDPIVYNNSIKKILSLPVKKILSAHHEIKVPVTIISEISEAFDELERNGKLKQGSGTFTYSNFEIEI